MPKSHLIPKSGIFPLGFLAGAVSAGIKKKLGALDMTLVVSQAPCNAAAVFTKNAFAAAPVQVDKQVLAARNGSGLRAVLVNAGCANACTGEAGLKDAWNMVKWVDEKVAIPWSNDASTLVMSTGVIGQPLPMDKVKAGIDALTAPNQLSSLYDGWLNAAKGIMTTDTFPKLCSKEFTSAVTGQKYRMAGWSKGAGMIHPNMATLLSAVFTDAAVSRDCLDSALKYAVERSFNAISVDGDTSTNDTLAVLANGASGGKLINDTSAPEYEEFRNNLTTFTADLAKLIVRDGEGATKFISIAVEGARTFSDAKTVASTVATSPLVKTAIFGKDANWGRIVCAVGYSGVDIDPTKVNLHFSNNSGSLNLHLFKDGAPYDVNEEIAAKILAEEDVNIKIDLGLGTERADMYTCDFSHEYISINADCK